MHRHALIEARLRQASRSFGPAPGPAARRSLGRALACLLLAALTACTTAYQPMGPAIQAGALQSEHLAARDGALLPLRRWLPDTLPPRAVIVALHGMNDYSRAFDAPARAWARHGIATYAYDQRGFGDAALPGIWPGTHTLVADLGAAVDAVRLRHPGVPVYLLGESMGGAVILAALAPDGPDAPDDAAALAGRIQGVVLSAPALWARDTLKPWFRAALWAGYRLAPGLQVRPPDDLDIQPSDNLDMLRELGRDPLVRKRTRIDALQGLLDLMTTGHDRLDARPRELPILVLYGQHEQVLARDAVTRVVDALRADTGTKTRLAIYPNGYHLLLRDLCAATVWEDVRAWIEDPAGALPSGGEDVAWQTRRPPAQARAAMPAGCAATAGR